MKEMSKKRFLSALLCLCLVLALTPSLSTPAAAYSTGDDYLYKYSKCGTGTNDTIDDWNFFYRECTSFVAWCLNSRNGVGFTNWYGGIRWGDAKDWGAAARSLGITVDNTPAVGAIAWWNFGQYGHVAWVRNVNAEYVYIEEYNGDYNHNYNERTIINYQPTGYIHIKDIPTTPAEPSPPTESAVNLGNTFYASIYNANSNCNLAMVNDNVQIAAVDNNDPKQIWKFTRQSDGYYYIVNEYEERCIDVANASTEWETNIQGVKINITPPNNAQKWLICGSGPYYFASALGSNHSRVLDVAGAGTTPGTNIQLYVRTGHVAQAFMVNKISSYSKPAAPAAPAIQDVSASVDSTTISWGAVPAVNSFDNREYEVNIYNSGTSKYVVSAQRVSGTSFASKLPEGNYTAEVRAVNTRYPDYASGWSKKDFTVSAAPVNTPTPEIPTTPDIPVTPDVPVTPNIPDYDPIPVDISFTDVPSDSYYYDAVAWAVNARISSGTGPSTFSPNVPCTRGQMVTFLWRAAGSPTVAANNPFTDVSADAYYYDAVLWAVSKGITSGTGSRLFSPNTTVTRGQAVSFLYRYAGSPASGSVSSFTDVDPGAYYADAVNWAVSNGITNGTSASRFSPNDPCVRSQTVTFLYRACK